MLDKVKELLKALENTSVEELEVETEGLKVRVKFKREKGAGAPAPLQETKTAEPVAQEAPSEEEKTNYYVVEAPMVGTFYRAPAPGAEPFVKEGDFVEKGQTLCIIEALKVMNEIESEVSGIVRKILVENGQPVEYGQPLFYIEPR
ncbi:acetyl-CoA carboxylase biotin carboxyl carrier protein [Phorcysia thermohydrogeniphila]|uniref:Biotin carboxyl carrier protein of acetyl-CoA carboxylase n=1 Tax=Phorcysia thermohydrogeniphila TaxID=936138 RepID=A0A4R1GCP8_9BACT|nr:acetyl-CoA carboxylase biotin carboxyl carrier protein [Phorcysia thermohydrogeniphila]TCK04573.1 acetyl-CoA carboxylase biotin carboxyl carrier protein [Phorcysia thermohydrogeniphila]